MAPQLHFLATTEFLQVDPLSEELPTRLDPDRIQTLFYCSHKVFFVNKVERLVDIVRYHVYDDHNKGTENHISTGRFRFRRMKHPGDNRISSS